MAKQVSIVFLWAGHHQSLVALGAACLSLPLWSPSSAVVVVIFAFVLAIVATTTEAAAVVASVAVVQLTFGLPDDRPPRRPPLLFPCAARR